MRETSRQRFIRLAESRVNKLIKTIRLLGNLSNKSNYSFTDNDVEKIFGAIEKELRQAKARYKTSAKACNTIFKIDR